MHIPLPTSCCFPLPFTIRNPIKRKKPEKSFTFLGLQNKPVPELLVMPPCTRDILANRTDAPAACPAPSGTAAASREHGVREEGNTEPRSRIDRESSGIMRGQSSGLGLSRRGGLRRQRTEARSVRSTTAVGSRIASSRSGSKPKFTEHIDASRNEDDAEAEDMHQCLRPQEYGLVDRSFREGCTKRGDVEWRGKRGGVVEGYLHDWRVW